ncbi:MAG TPA: nuclear transport factor 2 family protein [Pirellulales bacterium]|nr:nuclear transport factor 2 family protein [Pirellulales bacterium]
MRHFGIRCPRLSRLAFLASAVAVVVTSVTALGQERAAAPTDEEAIRERGKEYIAAIKRGDANEIASFWTAEGTYVDEGGHAVNGRSLAHEAKGERDEGEPRKITVTIESIHFVTPDVAVEDGRLSNVPGVLSGSLNHRYTAIWVRQKGKWLLDGIRESAVATPTHNDHLRDLGWMVGDWISDDDGKTVRLSCRWSNDKNFLLREIDVRLPGREPLHVTQRIGWDAREGQVKSWTFDSEGGHGVGLWFHKDDRWIVEAESVLPDGSRATGTNVLAQDGNDAFTWESSNGEVEGEPVPELKVRMTRTTTIP